jgi:2-phosphoglycolate phosphatase
MSNELSFCRAVLFDFDGTLADSYGPITASVNHVRAVHDLPPLSEAEVRRHVGRGPHYLMEHTVPGGDVEADVARYRAHHPSVMFQGTRLLPGAAAALAAAKATGRQVGVCSNKPVAFSRQLLKYLQLADKVDLVLGPEDVARPKPAPDMLQTALARLAVPAEVVLYVGDMIVDVQTARAAGIRVWVVSTGSEERAALEQARPDRILRDLGELAEVLKSV